jgi:hypothetical protein
MRYFKNYQPPSDLLAIGLIIIWPMLLFWRWLLRGEVLFWGTLLLQFWPWHHLVKSGLLKGELPLWNPLLGNGTPLLANLQSAVFYPPNLIYMLLPVEQALTVSVIVHVILAGLLMYCYTRHLGLRPFAATISALAFMFSGYFIGRTQFVTMVNAIAWFPLLLLLSDNIAIRRAKINILWLGIVLAIQLLAGHAQLWFYGLLLIGAYTIFRSRHRPSPITHTGHFDKLSTQPERSRREPLRITYLGRSVWRLTLAVIIALLLAAVQLLPTAEFVGQSSRSGGADRTFALTYSFWPWRLITLLAPDFFGHPAQGNYWGYATYWEDHAYMGVLPFILALVAVWNYFKRRWGQDKSKGINLPTQGGSGTAVSGELRADIATNKDYLASARNSYGKEQPLQVVPFFAGLIPISLVLALGWNTPIYLWIFDTIPGFSFFRAPARLLIWYTIALAVLAGVGAQFFESTPANRRNWRRLLAACVALTVAGFGAGSLITGRSLTFLTAIQSLGVLLVLSITLLLIRPKKGNSRFRREAFWQWLIIIFVGVDLLLAALPLIQTLPPDVFRRPSATAKFLEAQPEQYRYYVDNRFTYNTVFYQYFQFKEFGPPEIAHWQGLKESLVSNFGVYAGLPAANNNDPLVVGRWQQLTQWLEQAKADRQARLLSMMTVAYFISATDNNWPILYNTQALTIQRVPDVLPRAYFVSRVYIAQDISEIFDRLTAPNFDPRQEMVIMADGERPALTTVLDTSPDVGPVTVKELASDQLELTVNAPGSGYVVLTDTFYPGWQATVDGRAVKIWPANLAFRAVAVEAGQHVINFNYRPRSFTFGLWTSIVTGLIIMAIIGWPAAQRLKINVSKQTRNFKGKN